jgi:NACHT domain- and WD repeat-containing protein
MISGLSESELEDLISLDDKVLDDVYQYHLPPTRRIPPLLWTRIRNDLPNYLSEREADGVNVMNWYHRQFRDTAKERYFKNKNMAMYFHSMIADYYLGIWGGGIPKPFKYTEIQRHRFNLTDKEGIADRKVPDQPLVFYNKEGVVCRYNLRKFGELPYHLIRSRRFVDLYKSVLFNYDWLHAKLSSCPLQAVLADFEDASMNVEEMEAKRELNLVADALRLGGAILQQYPDMLASQLIGRLLPEIGGNPNIKMLLEACDTSGPKHSALIPMNHCLHTPGGPLKYSLEGHQFAVFGFCLTSDSRFMVSISTRFITWDLGTSDLTRDVNPGIEGIMQQLVLSGDNKWAGAYTNNNQCVLLNMLSSEFTIINNPFEESDNISGVYLLNQAFFIYSKLKWAQYDMRGQLQETHEFTDINGAEWELLLMEFLNFNELFAVFWSGSISETRLRMHTQKEGVNTDPVMFHSAYVMNKERNIMFCCKTEENFQVFELTFTVNDEVGEAEWQVTRELPRYENDEKEMLLQLKLDQIDRFLIGTTGNGFVLWDSDTESPLHEGEAIYLPLPHGVRNISTKMMQSNSIMMSLKMDYAIAGVRKDLYVWSLESKQLMKVLDAHFGRIMQLESLTVGNWNCCVTSSIDRSVKGNCKFD